jgi:hypothetical protein
MRLSERIVMRDFLYNKSDVLVALLIIVIAALVIFSRVGVLMNFSEAAEGAGDYAAPVLPAGSGDSGVSGASVGADMIDGGLASDGAAEPGGGTAGIASGGTAGMAASGDTVSSDDTAETGAGEVSAAAEDTETGTDGELGEIVTFSISAGDSASKIADNLLNAGLIANKQAFLNEVVAQKADTLLLIGSYQIPMGSTLAEIVDILTA